MQVMTAANEDGRIMQAEIVRKWLTYKEAEQLVGLSRTTLWQLINAGEIDFKRIGRAVRINRESLEAYMRGESESSATDARTA